MGLGSEILPGISDLIFFSSAVESVNVKTPNWLEMERRNFPFRNLMSGLLAYMSVYFPLVSLLLACQSISSLSVYSPLVIFSRLSVYFQLVSLLPACQSIISLSVYFELLSLLSACQSVFSLIVYYQQRELLLLEKNRKNLDDGKVGIFSVFYYFAKTFKYHLNW